MKFENTQVLNFEGAFRGMRNPMDSWDKSDSKYCLQDEDIDCDACPLHNRGCNEMGDCLGGYVIGKNDLDLARKLIKAGSEHRKFLRQIFISVDISAPRYWWAEFDTYGVGVVKNSCSTMHKLNSYPIIMSMFELDDMESYDEEYWTNTIKYLESLRLKYLETKDYSYFRKLKQALPESFIQKRTVTMNYENILNMTNHREAHKLFEWSSDFINWKNSLPYSDEFLSKTRKEEAK